MEQGYIKLSNDVLLASEEDASEFYLIDPKTCGVLDTYSAVIFIQGFSQKKH